jgi:hypothetical protein
LTLAALLISVALNIPGAAPDTPADRAPRPDIEALLCADRQALIRVLQERHGETRRTAEQVGDGLVLEVYRSERSYTVVLSNGMGTACVLATASE